MEEYLQPKMLAAADVVAPVPEPDGAAAAVVVVVRVDVYY